MIDKSLVIELVEERLGNEDLFLVSAEIAPGNRIKIVLDGDHGVSINKCISVSRNVEHNLDREEEDFSLEVTSFGLDQALILERQYLKYINKNVEVYPHEGDKIVGKLLSYTPEEISLELELTKKQIKQGEEAIKTLSFSDIKEVKSVISFK